MDPEDDFHGLNRADGTVESLKSFSRLLETISWDDAALHDRAEFETSLRQAGLSEASVSEALAARDRGAAEMAEAVERLKPYENIHFEFSPPEHIEALEFYAAKKRSALEILGDWWKDRIRVVGPREAVLVKVPVFVLGTPSAPGCKAAWTTEITTGFSDGWSLQLAGSGLGSDTRNAYVSTASFEASSGQTKMIVCHVPLEIELVEILEPGKPTIRHYRVILKEIPEKDLWLSPELLSPDAAPAKAEYVRPYLLAADPTAAPAVFSQAYVQASRKKVTAGFSAHGVQLSLSATSDFESAVTITHTLSGGMDYGLFRARDYDGYLFGSPS